MVVYCHELECHGKRLVCYCKVKLTVRTHIIEIWLFLLYSWSADLSVTKPSLIVHDHKPEYFVKRLDCCVQGQGYSESSELYWMFIEMMSSKPLNVLQPNWYGDASAWAGVSFEQIGWVSLRSRSQWWLTGGGGLDKISRSQHGNGKTACLLVFDRLCRTILPAEICKRGESFHGQFHLSVFVSLMSLFLQEMAVLSLNAYLHLWDIEAFQQVRPDLCWSL